MIKLVRKPTVRPFAIGPQWRPVGAVPGTELKRPSAGAPSAGWKDRLARTHTAAEPTGQGAKEEADGAQQCGARHRLSRCVGGLRRLLLGLIYCLPILLLVLLNLRASMAAGAWVMPRFGLAPKMRYRTTSHFCISCNFVVAWMSLIVGSQLTPSRQPLGQASGVIGDS
jgi:hypothetical protein